MMNLVSQLLFLEVEAILKEYGYCKKVMKKHFNKNLIMSEKEEEKFQSSTMCWMFEKLIDDEDEKIRDHCHITGKFRGAAHWTKKIPLMFQNLRGYDSHLIFVRLTNLM